MALEQHTNMKYNKRTMDYMNFNLLKDLKCMSYIMFIYVYSYVPC